MAQNCVLVLWNDENLFRGGVLHFAARRVTADVDIAPVRIKRVKHIPRLSRHRFGRREVCDRR